MKAATDAILQAEAAAYLERIEPARDALLAEMEAYASDRGEPISDPEVASFLAVTTRAARPRSIVELGTNIGYGAIVLARSAGVDARVVHRSPELAERVARLTDRPRRELARDEHLAAEAHRRPLAQHLAPGGARLGQERELLAPGDRGERLDDAQTHGVRADVERSEARHGHRL